MIAPKVVCIPMAGKGSRMGELGRVVNKALLPLGEKAIISRIIDLFPAAMEFIIALGDKGEQVRDYLSLAHPDLKVHFVEVDNYDGPGSGPGYSVLCCRPLLQRPFWFVPCDCLYTLDFNNVPPGNWVGVAAIEREQAKAYCNFGLNGDHVIAIYDKEAPQIDRFAAFTGLLCVRDFEPFWAGLSKSSIVANEHQISSGLAGLIQGPGLKAHEVVWQDIGDREKYNALQRHYINYDFSKTNEFLYMVNGRVVKFFADEKVVAARVAKASLKTEVFPFVEKVRRQFYSYAYVPGETLYKINDYHLFGGLLGWMDTAVWSPVTVDSTRMKNLCWRFYHDKTKERLGAFSNKYPNYRQPLRVNGKLLPTLELLLAGVPWDELCEGVPVFIHGDLQFDNILYDRHSERFCLLDWRQDFAGEIAFGDLYYDLAKLWGSINLNYDYIKAGLFRVEEYEDGLIIDFAQRFSGMQLSDILREYVVARGLSWHRVRLLAGLIYLNMAPLHHPPFDITLMALGRTLLADALEAMS